jgi:hypothetical protein
LIGKHRMIEPLVRILNRKRTRDVRRQRDKYVDRNGNGAAFWKELMQFQKSCDNLQRTSGKNAFHFADPD